MMGSIGLTSCSPRAHLLRTHALPARFPLARDRQTRDSSPTPPMSRFALRTDSRRMRTFPSSFALRTWTHGCACACWQEFRRKLRFLGCKGTQQFYLTQPHVRRNSYATKSSDGSRRLPKRVLSPVGRCCAAPRCPTAMVLSCECWQEFHRKLRFLGCLVTHNSI